MTNPFKDAYAHDLSWAKQEPCPVERCGWAAGHPGEHLILQVGAEPGAPLETPIVVPVGQQAYRERVVANAAAVGDVG